MICKPEKPRKDFWMNYKIVNGAQKPPVKSKLRTDDSFNVSPVFRIIPKSDFHTNNKNHSGNVLKKCNAQSHQAK